MDWAKLNKDFTYYLKLEKSLSHNSIIAYLSDIQKLSEYCMMISPSVAPLDVSRNNIQDFLEYLHSLGICPRTQARIVSSIKSFYSYIEIEDLLNENPARLIEAPRIGKYLPTVLTITEIDNLIDAIDLSKPLGHRNKAIIEVLYSCGLRVSELTNLKISNIYFSDEYIKIQGKGKKERLVPLSSKAKKEINLYLDAVRKHILPDKDHTDYLFLNRRGKKLTRVMIFTIVKNLATAIGMEKNISPHTFRHSFATHLVEGGADLRAVQEILGHESIITTEIYTHLDKEYLKETIIQYHPRS